MLTACNLCCHCDITPYVLLMRLWGDLARFTTASDLQPRGSGRGRGGEPFPNVTSLLPFPISALLIFRRLCLSLCRIFVSCHFYINRFIFSRVAMSMFSVCSRCLPQRQKTFPATLKLHVITHDRKGLPHRTCCRDSTPRVCVRRTGNINLSTRSSVSFNFATRESSLMVL